MHAHFHRNSYPYRSKGKFILVFRVLKNAKLIIWSNKKRKENNVGNIKYMDIQTGAVWNEQNKHNIVPNHVKYWTRFYLKGELRLLLLQHPFYSVEENMS